MYARGSFNVGRKYITMLRFIALFLFAALASEAAHATRITRFIDAIKFTGTVESVIASNKTAVLDLYHSGKVFSVDRNDPRFLLTVKITKAGSDTERIVSGSSVVFGIHSPVMLFDTTESAYIVGRTYNFRIARETSDKSVTYAGIEVVSELKTADSTQTKK
jgi:hypothetical protein